LEGFFNNEGVFLQDAGTWVTTIDVPFRNSGEVSSSSGTIIFNNNYRQVAGSTDLRGISFRNLENSNATVIFDGGSVAGATTIDVSLINSAAISVGAPIGEIHVNDSVTLLNGSRLVMEIGGRSKSVQFDSLYAKTLDLGGILDVRFARGFESSITSSDSFNIITTTQIPLGNFDNVDNGRVSTSDGLGSFREIISSTGVTLTDFQPVPEPMALLSMIAPAVIFLTRRRSR